jgi:hypothetical protein
MADLDPQHALGVFRKHLDAVLLAHPIVESAQDSLEGIHKSVFMDKTSLHGKVEISPTIV